MDTWYFVYGRTPDLSHAEILSFFPHALRISENTGSVHGALQPENIHRLLGGTIKIAREISGSIDVDRDVFMRLIVRELTPEKPFGISRYGRAPDELSGIEKDIKKFFSATHTGIRYVTAKDGDISSVVITRENVQECIIICDKKRCRIGKTVSVQDYEYWGKKDFGRPVADAKSGMLPPKVSRMIVNIARGYKKNIRTLLDPFCGMGTILAEALLTGCENVIGSDTSEHAISGAKQNLQWLNNEFQPSKNRTISILCADAVHISAHIPALSVDAIVTEPYMGPTAIGEGTLSESKAKDILKGLEKMYIGCLRDWDKVLVAGGVIAIALPVYIYPKCTYRVKKVIDTCEKLGYTLLCSPVLYGRDNAKVKREFYFIRKGMNYGSC